VIVSIEGDSPVRAVADGDAYILHERRHNARLHSDGVVRAAYQPD
jgi:hypothetical protein